MIQPQSRIPTIQPNRQLQKQQQAQVSVSQEHTDVIHDTQFDYYGELLATASSDRTIGIHVARAGLPPQRVTCLAGHEGPVWMVSWAHPRFGRVLASASFDQKAIIWKESGNRWQPVHVVDIHQGSVNAVSWAPDVFGPLLASASSDGTVAITLYRDGVWQESVKVSNNRNQIAHAMGATCVSFAPWKSTLGNRMILASGGWDCHVRLWIADAEGLLQPFKFHQLLEGHSEWVQDVAFCPASAASRCAVLASCGKDKSVVLYRKPWEDVKAELESGGPLSEWERSVVLFDEPVWRLSWSPSGEILIATTASAEVFVLREGVDFTESWMKTPLKEFNP